MKYWIVPTDLSHSSACIELIIQGSNYTIYNKKYFQKVSFCVITHPIGQNGGAVCKKHGNHEDARGAKRRTLGAAGRPAGRPLISIAIASSVRVRMYEYSLGAGWPSA